MRLPSVSLTFAVGVLLALGLAPAEARGAVSEPVLATNCMDLAEPKTSEEVVPPLAARPHPVPTPLDARGLADAETYRHVFEILSTDNSCSDFYGGPVKAAETFNQFAKQIKRGRLANPRVALRMTGTYTHYTNHTTGASYRLFEEATLNNDGPITGQAARMYVGSYPGYTPQARALVLLHELGHLVPGRGGGWLLPNDGDDAVTSAYNTRLIEIRCGAQLNALRD